MSKKKIIAAINKYQRFLITAHINPDGDAIGSELALGNALRQMGKEVTICNRDEVPASYRFLPGVEQIKLPHEINSYFEVLIVLDCGHIDRVGAFTCSDFKLVINIDHHYTNQAFGDINWIRPQAPCAGKLVFELISGLPVEITREIATCVYTALMTDTGCFCYSNTTAGSFQLASKLVRCGADSAEIAREVYETMSLAKIRLLGESLKTLEFFEDGAVASMMVSQRMLDDCGAQPADTEDFVNYPRGIQVVKVALFWREVAPDSYKISLRSKTDVDVAALAEKFNGGGHFHAAGCRIEGDFEVVKQEVVQELKKALAELPPS